MKIDVYYKTVYGNDLCYPACKDAKVFADISKQKTLSVYTLDSVRRLGYNVNVVAMSLTDLSLS
jgi:hypothetical protein